MGAYDGAEVCELVGSFLLSLIAKKYKKADIGLYRDDGLAIFKNTSGPVNERIKKDFQSIFRSKGLEIVIQCNMKVVDYLDVTLNLNDGTHKAFRKPDDETRYIHVESDHPPSITKQLPISIEKRISDLSSSKKMFEQSKQHYQNALNVSGYTYKLEYKPSDTTSVKNRRRKRKVIWFTPPFSKIVETNIGRKFLNLLKKHFPKTHKFHKLFNKNNVKISYGCMPNMNSTINAHNKKILVENTTLARSTCNCNNPDLCPLDGECTTPNVLYEAELDSNLEHYKKKIYIGITEPKFKARYGNHKTSFSNVSYKNETELSKEVWKIKENGGDFYIKWRIINQFPGFNPSSGKCALCLNEKLAILQYKGDNLLNKRSEIVSTCRHKAKFKLEIFDVK